MTRRILELFGGVFFFFSSPYFQVFFLGEIIFSSHIWLRVRVMTVC